MVTIKDFLVKLVDGGIKTIATDKDSYPGCETCDYGSKYVNEYYITLTTGVLIIKASEMYDYPLTEGYMMETILPNVDLIKTFTEQEFIAWMEDKLGNELSDKKVEITFTSY